LLFFDVDTVAGARAIDRKCYGFHSARLASRNGDFLISALLRPLPPKNQMTISLRRRRGRILFRSVSCLVRSAEKSAPAMISPIELAALNLNEILEQNGLPYGCARLQWRRNGRQIQTERSANVKPKSELRVTL